MLGFRRRIRRARRLRNARRLGARTEWLEPRQLLTVVSSFESSVLTISSDAGDAIVVSTDGDGVLSVNGNQLVAGDLPLNAADVADLIILGDSAVNTIDVSGVSVNLPISIDGDGSDDIIVVGTLGHADDASADTIDVSPIIGGVQVLINGSDRISIVDLTSSVEIVGSSDNDAFSFNINFFGVPNTSNGLTYNGTTGSDSLVFRGTGFFNSNEVTHTVTGNESGNVGIDSIDVAYVSVADIEDRLSASDRAFVFTDGDDQIVMSHLTAEADGITDITSTSSNVNIEFAQPTNEISIDAGAGNDSVDLLSIDPQFTNPMTIRGRNGDDVIDATLFNLPVTIVGGNGDDEIFGSDFDDKLFGSDGNDALIGNGGNDALNGQDGDDFMSGGTGIDSANGGAGDDVTFWAIDDSIDIIAGGDGIDGLAVFGTTSDDQFTITNVDSRVTIGLTDDPAAAINAGGTEVFLLDLGEGDDHATIGSLVDVSNLVQIDVHGGSGDDLIDGSHFDHASGVLSLEGQDGNDLLTGSAHGERICGGAGDDTITGGAGQDTLLGQLGDDLFVWAHGDGSDTMSGNLGNDRLEVSGSALSDGINIGSALSRFTIDVNAEILNVGTIEAANIEAGSGNDSVFIGDISTVSDLHALRISGNAGDDGINASTAGFAIQAFGGSGDDVLFGGSLNDSLVGNAGNDQLFGGDGDDVLRGGTGNDSVDGGNADDRVFGSSGDDVLIGGAGEDRINAGSGNDGLSGGAGDDILLAQSGDDTAFGGEGNDRILGQTGSDILSGESDDDIIKGGSGEDTIGGGIGNDSLFGNEDDDLILGATGDDSIDAAEGADIVNGGDGQNTIMDTVDQIDVNAFFDFDAMPLPTF